MYKRYKLVKQNKHEDLSLTTKTVTSAHQATGAANNEHYAYLNTNKDIQNADNKIMTI